jgi:chromosome segregation ATPase
VTTIQILSQKISQLEDSNNNLSQLLNDEISQRQNLEKHSITSLDAFSGQLNILKNNYEKMEEVLIENISKMKEDIKSSNPGRNNKAMNNNYVEDIFKNEFAQCRNEINKNTQKLEILENQLNITNKEYQQNLNEINKKVDNCISELRLSKDFQKQTKLNFQSIREEFQRNLNNNQNFLNDVNSIIIDFKKNMDVYNSSYNKYTTELNKLHENLCLDRDNNNNRIDNIEKGINTYINERNQEWDNFENHLLNEYEKFINFIQTKFDELNEGVKKLVDYNGEDINIMKEKMDLFQEANKKLRIDLFKGLNETEDFFEKKYNSILKIINK